MNIGIDFYVVQFIVESTEGKENHYKLNLSLLSTLEIHLAFYLLYASFFLFNVWFLHIPLTTPSTEQTDTQEIANEECLGSKAKEGNSE